MIYDVTLMYSLKLFLDFNGWETGCVEFFLFIYFLNHYLSSRTWMSALAESSEQLDSSGIVVQEYFHSFHQAPFCSLFFFFLRGNTL